MIQSHTRTFHADVGVVSLLGPALAAAKTSAADVSRHTGETWNIIQGFSQDSKNETVVCGKQLPKETDFTIARIEFRVPRMSAVTTARY